MLAGVLCAACAPSYYLTSAATCLPCPSDSAMVRKKLEGAVPFVCMMVGLYVTMALAVWRLKATTRKAAEISWQAAVLPTLLETNRFCLGIVGAFQILASSASSMPPDLPSAVSYLFTFLSFFNADSSAVSYEGCGPKTYPFAVPLGSMVVALGLLGLHGLLELLKKTRRRREDEADFISAGAGLGEGATVVHGNCGQGAIVTIDDAVEPGKPVLVQYKTGDLCRHSLEEAKKLQVHPPGSRTLSRYQALIFTALTVLYALIAKNCLRFLNCRRSPNGELLLASGPATSRVAVVGGTAVTETVLMRFAASLARAHVKAMLDGMRAPWQPHRCWSGDHLAVGVLSIVLFVLLVLGMPLFSFVYLHRRRDRHETGRVTGSPKPCRCQPCQRFTLELT